MNAAIKTFTKQHVRALRAHLRENDRWGTPEGHLTPAARECIRAGLIECSGWQTRTAPAGLSLLAALDAAKAGEL